MDKKICIFCGSNTGIKSIYSDLARQMGHILVDKGYGLVYGGGKVGLMGIIADAVLEKGGEAIGVIPDFLWEKEVGHNGLTELRIVDSMHVRKQTMADMSNGFIAMPGGIGTLEEIAEAYTWNQLGLLAAPFGLLNVDGYYDPLIEMFDKMVAKGFMRPNNRAMLLTDTDPASLLQQFEDYHIEREEKWI